MTQNCFSSLLLAKTPISVRERPILNEKNIQVHETVKRLLKGDKFTLVACNYRAGHYKVNTSLAKAI